MNLRFTLKALTLLLTLAYTSVLAAGESKVQTFDLNFLGAGSPKNIQRKSLYGPYYPKLKEVMNRFERPLRPGLSSARKPDAAAQNMPATANMNAPIGSFDAISNKDQSALSGFFFTPPDTVGDVGPNHYVQMVNTAVEIFDKDGNSLEGPFLLSDLFAGSGSPCETKDDGDPIVVYDPLADRWLLTQFIATNPSHECIAISQTSDPTGDYFLYDSTNNGVK